MKNVLLDMTNIQTVRALHVYLAYKLGFPAYYGKNLDALHDMLCEESEDICIVLMGLPASEEMAAYLPRLERVLADSAQENRHICFEKV